MSAIVLSRTGTSVALPRNRRQIRGNTNKTALVVRGANQNNNMQLVRYRQLAPPQRQQPRVRAPRNRGTRSNVLSSVPQAYGLSMTGGAPQYRSAPTRGGIVVSHSEIVLSPTTTQAFTVQRMALVPNIFAWLQGLARCFSRYRWLSLRADFVTSSSTNVGGSVAMGATYDVPGELPNSLAEMKALAHSFVGPVWSTPGTIQHSVVYDGSRWSKPYYSYNSNPPSQPVTYIPAFLHFAAATTTNGQPLGNVVISYAIEFLDPIPARINEQVNPTVMTEAGEVELITSAPPLGPQEPTPMDNLVRAVSALLARAADEDGVEAEEANPAESQRALLSSEGEG